MKIEAQVCRHSCSPIGVSFAAVHAFSARMASVRGSNGCASVLPKISPLRRDRRSSARGGIDPATARIDRALEMAAIQYGVPEQVAEGLTRLSPDEKAELAEAMGIEFRQPRDEQGRFA